MQLNLDTVRSPLSAQDRVSIDRCRYAIEQNYQRIYGPTLTDDVTVANATASEILPIIACTDAPYHNLEHTVAVISVGQQILEGKHYLEGNVSRQDWLDTTMALMFHDAGYIKGACLGDRVRKNCYVVGEKKSAVQLSPHCTDASLTPYHVSRGQLIVEERLGDSDRVNITAVKAAIAFTQFPVPPGRAYRDSSGYPGLVRAADLIGQLADPAYLSKLGELFEELSETGAAQKMGYHCPNDLRAAYPRFYRRMVYPYIKAGLLYLSATPQGRQTVASLYQNLAMSEVAPTSTVDRSDFQLLTIDDYGQIS